MGKKNPKISKYIARPLIRFGIPLSVMGLLLKVYLYLPLIGDPLHLMECQILLEVLQYILKSLDSFSLGENQGSRKG